jgi:uncharacterized protein YebE (UPF0316 family)
MDTFFEVTMVFEPAILFTGLMIFFARIIDVSIGTMRVLITVQGRTKIAFILGFTEVLIWVFVVSAVISSISENPIIGFFYALGFASGNVVGILVERHLAIGHINLRITTNNRGREIVDKLREKEYPVTVFTGEGAFGPVLHLYIVCKRRDLKVIITTIESIQPGVFYVTEPVGVLRRTKIDHIIPATGWRSVMKRK